jgi:predicted RNase H-like nuclease
LTVQVVGIDGTKGGWVGVELEDGRFVRDHLLRPETTEFREIGGASVLAVDIPIGYGPRQADAAARAFLGGAAARTVFTTPTRDMLMRPFGPGLGVSAQAHALGPRVIHATALAARDARIYEAHPEVSFRAMNGGVALDHRKKSAGGALERIELLRAHGIEVQALTAAAAAPVDDVLDAAACAWTAHRIASGEARTLPDPPELVDGRRMAIWY